MLSSAPFSGPSLQSQSSTIASKQFNNLRGLHKKQKKAFGRLTNGRF